MFKKPDNEDEVLPEFVKQSRAFLSNYVPFDDNKCFVAGGFFPRFFHGLPLKDIDVYVNDSEYLIDMRKEYKRLGWDTLYYSDKYQKLVKNGEPDIDLISFHSPNDFTYIKSFDFTICQFAIDHKSYYSEANTFRDIQCKFLIYTGKSSYSSKDNNILTRLVKYSHLGFRCGNSDLTKLFYDIKNGNISKFAKYNKEKVLEKKALEKEDLKSLTIFV